MNIHNHQLIEGEERAGIRLTAIDLFCGAGGLTEGLRQAGFKVLAGNDIDALAGRTFENTHKDACFLPGPIEKISAQDFLGATGLKSGDLDCLVGGPPCQAYSVYNHKRGMHDARSHLFVEYLRMVRGLKPKWIIIENVVGILSAGAGAAKDAIINGLNELGYEVEFRILKAEDYGVPQERRRVVFIGNRIGAQNIFPNKTHGVGLAPFTTIEDAISDLPPLENGGGLDRCGYLHKAKTPYQRLMREHSHVVLNHKAPKLSPINLKRMSHVPPGGSWRDIPVELLPEGMKRARRCDHTKRYGRLSWSGLSSTILTKCDVHWGAYIHPEQDRAISVREAARIQSFPDWFEFIGSKTEQYVQVGNAVPPLMGKRIGEAVLKATSTLEASIGRLS
ncbi:MAG: DNA cytosine methyltransferase [Ahrensia sp.]